MLLNATFSVPSLVALLESVEESFLMVGVSFMAQETGLAGKTGRYQPLLSELLISDDAAAVKGPDKALIKLKNNCRESIIIRACVLCSQNRGVTSAPVSKNGRKCSKEEG